MALLTLVEAVGGEAQERALPTALALGTHQDEPGCLVLEVGTCVGQGLGGGVQLHVVMHELDELRHDLTERVRAARDPLHDGAIERLGRLLDRGRQRRW